MKSITFGTIVLLAAVLLNGCNHIGSVQMNKALEHFIRFEQIVNEHDALSRELDWHEPRVIQKQKTRNLTGKDLISLCNKYGSEPDSQANPMFYYNKNRCDFHELKEFGIEHPDKNVAVEFTFKIECLNYSNTDTVVSGTVVYVPKLDQSYIIHSKWEL